LLLLLLLMLIAIVIVNVAAGVDAPPFCPVLFFWICSRDKQAKHIFVKMMNE
jgi:hypothetical protein